MNNNVKQAELFKEVKQIPLFSEEELKRMDGEYDSSQKVSASLLEKELDFSEYYFTSLQNKNNSLSVKK